ncbi:MAG: glycoside hydrolase family 9 protein [Clostridia bacterium]|nr:glycoside hydrolase family 9 protein [Clostridia bacterium]
MKKLISELMAVVLLFSGCTNTQGVKTSDKNENDDSTVQTETQTQEAKTSTITETESTTAVTDDNSNVTSTTTDAVIGTITGTGYEGIPGTGNYNYGEALQKSLIFYELQRSGKLPQDTRCNWRGDSCISDGASEGLDLSGGWFDAGDNVKFNLPMAYTASVLAWSVFETPEAYSESGQLEYALGNIRWANEYFIKCHPEDEIYYYQVGNGSQDHSWWGPCEVIENEMERPCYKVDSDNPGSAVTAETAASLALCSLIWKESDPDFADECLKHAKSLYEFAEKYKSDSGYTAANGFYDSWSGFYDELAWAGVWLYYATDDSSYIDKSEEYYKQAGHDSDWAFCWDDVHIGAALMLAQITGKDEYKSEIEKHLDFWTDDIAYTPKGLAWLDSWGSLRYATTTAFIAEIYAHSDMCAEDKASDYMKFAQSQADYALGASGRSFQIGYGENYPVHPHHRTAQGSYCDNMNEPQNARHILCGALVGGPDANDSYTDEVSNYNTNEVACDYNAGFTGLLAYLYSEYHGETIKDFGCFEEPTINEYSCEASINTEGNGFTEIKVVAYNETAWPARTPENNELRYFIDLSEVVEAGYSADDVTISSNYMQDAVINGIGVWNEEDDIYYLSVSFDEAKFYPGGQSEYKKEIQVRLIGPDGIWDSSNDPSYQGLQSGSMSDGINLAMYENGSLVYGTEPGEGGNSKIIISDTASTSQNSSSEANVNSEANTNTDTGNNTSGTVESEDLTVTINYNNNGNQTNCIAGELKITNNGDTAIAVNELKILYYLTNDDNKSLDFACYHAAVLGADGSYNPITDFSGKYDKIDSGSDLFDTVCVMTTDSSLSVSKGAYLTISFSINCSDWSVMNTDNDYSFRKPDNIVIQNRDTVIFGEQP